MDMEKEKEAYNRGEMVMKKCYEAMIFEKDGIIESNAYKCNRKDKCYNNEICGRECKHTLNKEYAIDIGDESDKQVIETNIYYEGKLVKKIIEYT